MIKVPEPIVIIPRIRPVNYNVETKIIKMPGPKKMTKWEKFAKEKVFIWILFKIVKGIQKKKKEPVIWDDETKQWRPRFGFNKKDNLNDKWVIETPKDYSDYL